MTGRIMMLALGLVLVGCDSAPPPVAGDVVEAVQATVDSTSAQNPMAEILTGEHRSAENKMRDKYRHPAETLGFFGLQPNSLGQ